MPTAASAERIDGSPRAEMLRGSAGADQIFGRGGADVVLGEGGADRIFGGPGADTLDGGGGRDRLDGGPGRDRLLAKDGALDQISCGPGDDVAFVDLRDRVGADCEVVKGGEKPPRPPLAVAPVLAAPQPPAADQPPAPEAPQEPEPEPEPEAEPSNEPIPIYEEIPIAMFPLGHGWTGNGVGSYGDAGASVVLNGDRSFRITTDGAGGESVATSPPLAPVDLRGSHVAFQSMISFSSRMDVIKVRLASGDIDTDYAEATVWDGEDPVALNSRFEMQSLPRSIFDEVGEVDWSEIDRAQIVLIDNETGPLTLYVAGIYAVPTYKTPTVSFAFDDGRDTTYSYGLKTLSAFRIPASLYVIADTIDSPGFLTEEQLYTLRNDHRWEIGGHAAMVENHNEPRGLDDLDPVELKADFDELRTWMDERGFARRTFAYPKGAASVEVRKYAARDYCAARVTAEGPETNPPRNPFTIRGWSVNGITTEAEELIEAIDRAATGKDWLILTFHNLVTGTPSGSTDFNVAALQEVAAHVAELRAEGLIRVRTIADAVGC